MAGARHLHGIRRVSASAFAGLLLLAACGGGGDQAASPADEATVEQTTPASPQAEPEVPTASCEDDSGDADVSVSSLDPGAKPAKYTGPIPDYVDLLRVDLSRDEESVTITFELAGELPEAGSDEELLRAGVGVGVYVDRFWTYGVGTDLAGELYGVEHPVKQGSQSKELDLADGSASVEGTEVVLELPLSELPRMEGEFSWRAYVEARKADKEFAEKQARASDACPNLTDQEQRDISWTNQKLPTAVLDKLPTQP